MDSSMVRRREALRLGLTDHEIRQQRRHGHWERIGRGCYLSRSVYEESDDSRRHRYLVEATLPGMARAAVLSHQSAAVMYGLPLWNAPLDRVHITRNRRNGGRLRTSLAVHCAPIDDGVARVEGVLLTSPARTIVDLARTLPFESALVVCEAAVRRFGIHNETLALELERAKHRRGAAGARRLIAMLDAHSESPGESRSRAMILRSHLPLPLGQGVVTAADGRFLGRVDFYFPDHGVVGEFDGRTKYGRTLRPGGDSAEVVYAEKLREDNLRDAGFVVVRWTWPELDAVGLPAKIRRALERGTRLADPTATIVQAPLPKPEPVLLSPLDEPHTC
ncbi:type IV toxin-antitoxin system AbiEi family antitoxin domain-containing protein [Aldersonia sp. NBC_00410]|uniref:type IV toxin-antitoxin system AbiEi family antitoxin domain-containing protein n=1 Tax=Aldersonia sp. NBC_00410 TaxID=2975954 RepID=UPI002253057C|nr:type IV toxin-antitoxin system AbiEi family antitoxin domain-containing protein [Aldersonia sp. NBC_00410]MCX5042088.1 type IV toxin-antitoxin system AbiEi family antitoxin domain-containing protein [Aldersonia sp. NBC_00410]